MQAEIISIGDELISGALVNTNARWLADRLAQAGVIAGTQVTVGDHLPDIEDAIRTAAKRCELVVITGGLGPTADDLTREALAAAMDQPLDFHDDSWKQIEEYFAQLGRTTGQSNRRQAMCPRTARPIPNSCGTAPGIHAIVCDASVFVLPGVPREMRVMFERDVAPEVSRLTGGRAVVMRTLHCFGAGEANTFDSEYPTRRIDYVWAAGPIAGKLVEARTLLEKPFRRNRREPDSFALSDHLPVMATFGA